MRSGVSRFISPVQRTLVLGDAQKKTPPHYFDRRAILPGSIRSIPRACSNNCNFTLARPAANHNRSIQPVVINGFEFLVCSLDGYTLIAEERIKVAEG